MARKLALIDPFLLAFPPHQLLPYLSFLSAGGTISTLRAGPQWWTHWKVSHPSHPSMAVISTPPSALVDLGSSSWIRSGSWGLGRRGSWRGALRLWRSLMSGVHCSEALGRFNWFPNTRIGSAIGIGAGSLTLHRLHEGSDRVEVHTTFFVNGAKALLLIEYHSEPCYRHYRGSLLRQRLI